MKKLLVIGVVLVAALFVLALVTKAKTVGTLTKVTIVRAIDGDTIVVRYSNGTIERVRLIGVNTQEMGTGRAAIEAKNFTAAFEGATVYLEFDTQQIDKYGRTLAYIWLIRPVSKVTAQEMLEQTLNGQLILQGYAEPMIVRPNTKYADWLTNARR